MEVKVRSKHAMESVARSIVKYYVLRTELCTVKYLKYPPVIDFIQIPLFLSKIPSYAIQQDPKW